MPLQHLLLLLLGWEGQLHAVLRQLGLLWNVGRLPACLHLLHLTLVQWPPWLQRLLLLLLLRILVLLPSSLLTFFEVHLLPGLRP